MSTASFSRPGAIDLSSLTNAAAAVNNGSPNGGSYVVDVTEANFDEVAQNSLQYPIVLELLSGHAPECAQLDATLVQLSGEGAGRWQLARVDIDTQPQIAQALGVQSVPTVIALIAGQVAPLFQGTRDAAGVRLLMDEVVKLAVANGVTGRARPSSTPASAGPGELPALDPRFAAADAALDRGDYGAAEQEFGNLLATNPKDVEAAAGKAQAGILARTSAVNVPGSYAAAEQDPSNVQAQLLASDLDIRQGKAEDALSRLIGLIPGLVNPARDEVRLRVLELFAIMDPADPILLKARRNLASALF